MLRGRILLLFLTITIVITVVAYLAPISLTHGSGSIRVYKVVGVEATSPQSRLLYPSLGCGDYLGLRVATSNGECIVIIYARNWSITASWPFHFDPRTMWALRGLEVCNGEAYALTMRSVTGISKISLEHNITTDFVTTIYRVNQKGMQVLARTSLYASSMLAEKDYIVLLGVNGTDFRYDLFDRQWWRPVIELRDYSGRLLARRILSWNISDTVLGGVLVETRLIELGHGLFLAVFGSKPNIANTSDKPRRLLLGLLRIDGLRIEPLKLLVFPEPGVYNVVHALFYQDRLYLLYSAPDKGSSSHPRVYVYDVVTGRLVKTMSNNSTDMRSGYLVVHRGHVYAVVFVPLLASSSLLPKPSAAALVTLHRVAPGLPLEAKQLVKIHGYVDWDFTALNHQLRDLDGDKRVDIVNKAFSVSFFGGRVSKVYLVDIELEK